MIENEQIAYAVTGNEGCLIDYGIADGWCVLDTIELDAFVGGYRTIMGMAVDDDAFTGD